MTAPSSTRSDDAEERMSEVDEHGVAEHEATPVVTPAVEQSPVSRALETLADIEATPLADHPDTYQQIHATLQDALAEIDGS